MNVEDKTSAAERWLTDGWVVSPGLVSAQEVEAAMSEVLTLVPSPEAFHRDPEAARRARRIAASGADEGVLPDGPDFRPEQFRWEQMFPFENCPRLNALCFHEHILGFVRDCLGTDDIRLYQAGLDIKYTGDTSYEQPLHIDSNHSYLPASRNRRWRHVEGFLYLTDVRETSGATRMLPLSESVAALGQTAPRPWPSAELESVRSFLVPGRVLAEAGNMHIYELEQPAVGDRGSLLAYGPQVLHRAIEITEPRTWRVILNVSFRAAHQEWVGFHSWQPDSTKRAWREMVAARTPAELEVIGFPPPGHEFWDEEMIEQTTLRYPGLDMLPWRESLQT
jgi:ectoine hydroxylase-related dioxygenase (phytanoyl-CoA dioxygenase family)